ncbi:hypothetical protein PybrP1_009458 [[Pythium] brassicae (nom. inval.)]|nr:hypothetical protein PybrP1_009458 [[Pythium] brassicae (nom. inval.)]
MIHEVSLAGEYVRARPKAADSRRSVFRYQNQNQNRSYNSSLADIVANSLVSMTIFFLKIVYRKRTLFKTHPTVAAERPCGPVPRQLHALSLLSAIHTSAGDRAHQRRVERRNTKQSLLSRLQQLSYAKRVGTFGAKRTVLPIAIQSRVLYPRRFLMSLYASALLNRRTCYPNAIQKRHERALPRMSVLCAAVGLATTASFSVSCAALKPRKLLKSLLTSFDLGFYALQLVERLHLRPLLPLLPRRVRCSQDNAVFWLLMSDALTPILKTKLELKLRVGNLVELTGAATQRAIMCHTLRDFRAARQDDLGGQSSRPPLANRPPRSALPMVRKAALVTHSCFQRRRRRLKKTSDGNVPEQVESKSGSWTRYSSEGDPITTLGPASDQEREELTRAPVIFGRTSAVAPSSDTAALVSSDGAIHTAQQQRCESAIVKWVWRSMSISVPVQVQNFRCCRYDTSRFTEYK